MLKQIVPKGHGGADLQRLARIFKVLGVDTRVRMLDMLAQRRMCVGALGRALDITPAAVSQHLRVLRDAGAVVAERQGYFVHYLADHGTLAAWGREIAAFFGAGEPGAPGAATPGTVERTPDAATRPVAGDG